MPRPMTVAEREEFLHEVRVATMSVENEGDRPPHLVPVWYAYEPSGNLIFFTGTEGRKARKTPLIRKTLAVTLNVQHGQFPYRYVTVEGTVTSIDNPPRREQALAIASRYLPAEVAHGFVEAELARGKSPFTLFTVRPEHWVSWDFTDER